MYDNLRQRTAIQSVYEADEPEQEFDQHVYPSDDWRKWPKKAISHGLRIFLPGEGAN